MIHRHLNRSVHRILAGLLWIAVSTLTAASAGRAQAPGELPKAADVAREFLSHYGKGDLQELEPFLGEDVRFESPSFELAGKEEVLAAYGNVFGTMRMRRLALERVVSSGAFHVLAEGRLAFTQDGSRFGMPDEEFGFDLPITIALKIVEGRVVRHIDYINTDDLLEQLDQQMHELGLPTPGSGVDVEE